MKYIVFETVNLANCKILIGVHKTEFDKFDGYLGDNVNVNAPSTFMNPHTPFQCAVKRYGANSFRRITLYTYDNAEDAYAKEAQLVDFDFIKSVDNYNVNLGGEYVVETEPLYQFDLNGNLVKKWANTNEMLEFFHMASIEDALKYKEKLLGYYWSRQSKINVNDYAERGNRKVIYKYSKEGKCIKVYSSITEALDNEMMNRPELDMAIKSQSLLNDSFYLSDKLFEEFNPKPRRQLKYCQFYVYDNDGKFLQKFDDGKLLFKFLDMHSWIKLDKAIKAGRYKQYQIFTEDKGAQLPVQEKHVKKINVYTKTGDFIKTCDDVKQAAKEFDAKIPSIHKCLTGVAYSASNYVFKYE